MESNYPADLKYTKDHEWARRDEPGAVTVGITAFAAEQLGDVTYVELPKVGTRVTKGASVAAVESVKAASDIYAPVDGIVTAVNSELEDAPERVNQSPYGDGWFFKLGEVPEGDLETLMGADEYRKLVEEQEE